MQIFLESKAVAKMNQKEREFCDELPLKYQDDFIDIIATRIKYLEKRERDFCRYIMCFLDVIDGIDNVPKEEQVSKTTKKAKAKNKQK